MYIILLLILSSTLGITLFHAVKEFGITKTIFLGLFPTVAYYFYPIILISILIYVYRTYKKDKGQF